MAFLPIARCKRVKTGSKKQNLANFLNFCRWKWQKMNIFGSVQLQILGKKLESTNNIRQLQSKFLLDENETTQPMRTRVTKVRQAKPSVQNYPKCKPCRAQKRKKNLKNQHCRLSILPPQIEYLHYPLNVEDVTQKGSLLPADKR